MQVTATAPVREHEKPMSWPRAVLIAVGFFFVTAILLGQLPSYVYTIVTLATLARFEQGFLDMGLIAVGLGAICFELVFLYDPRPLVPWQLFAGLGAVIAAVGLFFEYQVLIGIYATNIFGVSGWSEYLPDSIQHGSSVTYWPNANQAYILNAGWFQTQSIDLSSVGMIAILIGGGMIAIAALTPFVLGGRLVGSARDLLVRLSLGLSIVIAAVWLSVYTFSPTTVQPNSGTHGALGNAFLFIALMLALFALVVWLLPVMVANRQQFMPAVYLHGVVGLIGMVGVPLLLLWVIVYPVVGLIHTADPNEIWVQCAQKNVIPGSCTFTQFTGYIICAIVFTNTFALLIAGLYFWQTRRNTVVLGGTIGLVFLAIAATAIHVDHQGGAYGQLPLGLIVATAVVVLAFIFTWATQREFAPTQAQRLGCMGQWLVLGTLLLFFLFGYAFLSMPTFFELESGLALFYQPGPNTLHDAFWASLLMGGMAIWQMTFLIRRTTAPITNLRKFIVACALVSVILLIASAVMGFHSDVLSQGINAMEGSDAVAVAGLGFGLVAVLASLYGAVQARGLISGWTVGIVVVALVGIAESFITYYLPGTYPELVIFGFVIAELGAFAYSAAGPGAPAEGYANGAAAGDGFVVAQP